MQWTLFSYTWWICMQLLHFINFFFLLSSIVCVFPCLSVLLSFHSSLNQKRRWLPPCDPDCPGGFFLWKGSFFFPLSTSACPQVIVWLLWSYCRVFTLLYKVPWDDRYCKLGNINTTELNWIQHITYMNMFVLGRTFHGYRKKKLSLLWKKTTAFMLLNFFLLINVSFRRWNTCQ